MQDKFIYKEVMIPVGVRMNIIGVPGKNIDEPDKIKLNWFDGKIKLIASGDDFMFTVLGMEEALIQAITIYTLNKDYISRIQIEEQRVYYENK